MDNSGIIKIFVKELEVYSKRKLFYPSEIAELLQAVSESGAEKEFEELIFQAKFLSRTREVINRVGPGTDGYDKLSLEFQSGIKKAVNTLDSILIKSSARHVSKIKSLIDSKDTEKLNYIMDLFHDLGWIKNWQIDGRPLPYSAGLKKIQSLEQEPGREGQLPLSRIRKSALLAAGFFILLLFFDPPVTVIGWILMLGIAVFLVYIIIQIFILSKTRSAR
ncbi:MAG: hypothetical protein JXA06_13305 [Bacteroidetes bacterium]|nr:hypothetical protein [Bacteroidota bacterium]